MECRDDQGDDAAARDVHRLESGAALGGPNDPDQQRRVLDATLALLSLDAPIDPVRLDERIDGGPPA